MNPRNMSLSVLLIMCACASSEPEAEPPVRALDPPQFNHVGKLVMGTAVYLGQNTVLSNWHMCSEWKEAISYNDPGALGPRYREGEPLDGWKCDGSDAVYAFPLESGTFCNDGFKNQRLGLELGEDRAIPPRYGFETEPVFAQRAIDLCIMRIKEGRRPVTVAPDDLLLIDTKPVTVGQEVVLGGYPGLVEHAVIERCRVVRGVEMVRDPDLVNPSDLVVPSFAIDCKTAEHGSSGSPVLDAHTGLLLGLLWTGECTAEGCGLHYISAASEWMNAQKGRPIEQYSQLDRVLRDFAAP